MGADPTNVSRWLLEFRIRIGDHDDGRAGRVGRLRATGSLGEQDADRTPHEFLRRSEFRTASADPRGPGEVDPTRTSAAVAPNVDHGFKV